MRIGLFTYGSRGDVQPYIALALRLMQEGFDVTLGAPENFKAFVESFGVTFFGLYGNAEEIIYSAECQKIIKSGNNLAFVKFLFSALSDRSGELFSGILSFCEGVDVVIANNVGATTVSVATEYLKLPLLILQLNPPVIETTAFPLPGVRIPNYARLNRLSYRLFYRLMWHFAKRDIIAFRKQLALPNAKTSVYHYINTKKIPVMHAFSEALISRPADWDNHQVVTGFITLDEQARTHNRFDATNPELVAWIKSGTKPIYIGFGSIPVPDPLKLRQMIADILEQTNERIILCQGWSILPDIPKNDRLFIIVSANHQWLFRQCKMVVSHGGIGTLTAAMKAGVPVIVISIFVDQPIWGDIITKKKLGIHLPWRKINTKKLVNAIQVINQEPDYGNRVAAVAQVLNREDGTGAVIIFMKKWLLTST
ncbi:glycosyltransferase [Mucilaginibacter sp. CSA2-8R]|uniref:glycosyltransferase n=1 Tax=Mucilaginibacter sp. CSA2-8R TaxID=3141542 RepID=UPI00315D3CE7